MTTNIPIKGRVAQILNERELVINRGSCDGVALGMKFAVLDPRGQDIKDPDTGDPLGSLHRPKVEVQVTRVEERLAVARTFKYREVNVGGRGLDSAALGGVAGIFAPPKYVRKYDTFRSEDALWKDLPEDESYVKLGDPVEQILEVNGDRSLDAQAGRATA